MGLWTDTACIYTTVEECDKALAGARIKRAELLAFGISNSGLDSINRYIDRILDSRMFLMILHKR